MVLVVSKYSPSFFSDLGVHGAVSHTFSSLLSLLCRIFPLLKHTFSEVPPALPSGGSVLAGAGSVHHGAAPGFFS